MTSDIVDGIRSTAAFLCTENRPDIKECTVHLGQLIQASTRSSLSRPAAE